MPPTSNLPGPQDSGIVIEVQRGFNCGIKEAWASLGGGVLVLHKDLQIKKHRL